MRLRTLGLAALLATSLTQQSGAVIRPKGADAPSTSATKAPRAHRTIGWSQAGSTHALQQRLAADGLGSWTAQWDRDTDVPLRMWSNGVLYAGANLDAAVAESAARQFLASHLATLAPGSSIGDFELITNTLDGSGEIRSVAFAQRAGGVRVLGGAVGFAFKRDRMVMVNSTALPHVAVATPVARLSSYAVHSSAVQWLGTTGRAVVPTTQSAGLAASGGNDRVIVPIVRPRVGQRLDVSYQLAEQVDVEESTGPGRWTVWVDAVNAAPIARKNHISYASGRVLFAVPDRAPQSGLRNPQPAPFAKFTVNGAAVTSTADGTITWAGTAAGSVQIDLTGTFVNIINKGGAARLSETVSLAPAGEFIWNKFGEELNDAQIDSYIYANQAKTFVKANMSPSASALGWLNGVLAVNVNENQTCNAFSTGDDVHFFKSSGQCENTGRMADVVYHEFGHSLHANSIIDGVGAFDGSLSEGLADTLAQAITGDHGMGRGFFKNDAPLRELDPAVDKKWPDDADGEPHDEGEIIGEALWDVRVNLEASMGVAEGYAQFLKVYYSVMQRSADIPSSFPEALLADDDDGNLDNGTPHQCELQAAFGAHGLFDPALTLGIAPPTVDNYAVSIHAAQPSQQSACPPPGVASSKLEWKLRGGQSQTIDMTQAGEDYSADIPEQLDGSVVQYKVTMTLTDGSTISFPNNAADPFYEMFIGPVTVLKCFDFEDGDVASWVKSSDWEVGAPLGLGTDPKAAFAGSNVFGLDLTKDGLYRSRTTSMAESPDIDLQGHTDVRLQYRRWLGVEDGFYDQARILANNAEVWTNKASPNDPGSGGTNHVDKEWRFQDVDLTEQAKAVNGGKLKIRFELTSDDGLEFGGWTLDDVCVVAARGVGLTCGNGVTDEGETCDDGNRTDGDGCDNACQTEGDDGGCCSSSRGAEGAAALSFLTLGLVIMPSRRRWRRRRTA